MSAGSIRDGQHLLRSWSKDQTVIAMSSGEVELHAACVAAQQAMERRTWLISTTWNCKWPANVATGIIGRQGLGKIETSGCELLVAAVSCARKTGQLQVSAVREQHGRSRDPGALDEHL